jgi:tetratricopeptide (TPR) repeat protein
MVPIVRYWVETNQEPADLYELLGRPRLDPDLYRLREAIRTAYAELLLYQNHNDAKTAQRVCELQRHLGAAEVTLSDAARLRVHHEAVLANLRDAYAKAKGASEADWDLPRLRTWLEHKQSVHPERVEALAQAILAPSGQALEIDYFELQDFDSGDQGDARGSDAPAKPVEKLPVVVPLPIARRDARARARAPATAMIGIPTARSSGWLGRVTRAVIFPVRAPDSLLRRIAGGKRGVLHNILRGAAVALAVGALAGSAWFVVPLLSANTPDSPAEAERVAAASPDARAEVAGQKATVAGAGGQHMVAVPPPLPAPKPESEAQPAPPDEPGRKTDTTSLTPSPPSSSDVDATIPEIAEAAKRFQQRDYDGAVEQLKSAVARNPDLPPANLVMARWFFRANEANLTRVALEKAVVEAPDDPDAFLDSAALALREGRVAEADTMLAKAGTLLQAFHKSEKRRSLMEASLAKSLAAVAESRRDWPLAQKHLEHEWKLRPKDSDVMQRLARVIFYQKKPQEALDLLRKAKETDPLVLAPEARLALFYEEYGDHRNARKWMANAVRLRPQDVPTRLATAQWALQSGELEEAHTHAIQALRLDPKSPYAKLLRGVVALFQRDYPRAEACFEDVYLQDPKQFAARNNLALALCEQDDPAKKQRAVRYAESNLRQYPKAAEAAWTCGWTLYKAGRGEEAVQAMRTAAPAPTISADAAFYCAAILADRGQKDQAKQLLEKTVKSPRPFAKRSEAEALLTTLDPESPWAVHVGDSVMVISPTAAATDEDKTPMPVPPWTVLKVLEVREGRLLADVDGRRGWIPGVDVVKK